MLVPQSSQDIPVRRPRRRWRPVDVAMLVAAACYGAAMLVVAVGLLLRLAG